MWGKTDEKTKPAASSGRGKDKQPTTYNDYGPPNDTYQDGRNPSDFGPPNDTYRDGWIPSDYRPPNKHYTNQDATHKARCGKCEHTVRECKESMDQMEQHYTEKLKKERTALKQCKTALDDCKEEFKSFKSRMAVDLKNELKAGDCESMDSPVSTTQLRNMYDKLIYIKWTEIRHDLKTKNEDSKLADELIRGMFEASRKDMDAKKKQLEEMFALHKHSTSPSPKDVVYNKLAAQNLQMATYHSRKEEVVKVPFRKYQERVPTELASPFRDLAAECYWLGCLMALNNPPLQPDWESLIPDRPSPDAWNFFPNAITITSSMETEPMIKITSSMETEPMDLKAMYEEISSKWSKFKDDFKSKEDRMLAEKYIREMFEDSRKDMDEKKEDFFFIHSTSPKDVTVYKKQAAQNLQMVYHSSKEEVVKVPLLKLERVPIAFKDLAAECYWLGCLMALNNPQLQPDWVDAWNIFPPKLTSSMEVPMQQGS